MKKHWFMASLLGALGSLYVILGVVALVDGKPWAMLGKSRAAPMSPEVTIIAGILFVAGSVYLFSFKKKKPIQSATDQRP